MNCMNKLRQSIISTILVATLALNPVGAVVLAQAPPPPPPNNAPPPPLSDTPPPAPTSAPPPAPNSDPTPTPVPDSQTQVVTPTPTPGQESQESSEPAVSTPTPTQASQSEQPTPTPTGSSETRTGDANSSGTIINDGNINTASTSSPATVSEGASPGISITNADNGSGSTNTGSVSLSTNNSTTQENSAAVNNTLNNSAQTGGNSASKNTASDASVTSGDANVSGTIVNNLNTNISGVMVSEFNVVDNHVGDIVLDFAANCVSGCAAVNSDLSNAGNGTNSTNTSVLNVDANTATFQSNDATLNNSLVLTADSGNNSADKNTGADSSITSGDANVSANIVNNVNNNIEGQIVYGVVNIYGDLHGDIIFPEEALSGCCGTGNAMLTNTGNGDGSTNDATLASNSTNTTNQANVATIENVLIVDAATGDNDASRNTGGNSSIETGNTTVNAQVVNVANNNVAGGAWWLVLVNEAGQWVGKIIGGNGGSLAGSQGTEFTVNPDGSINVTNADNGAGSTNQANAASSSDNTINQTNNATVVNTLDLSANTGKNSTSKNTNGNNSITSGDATIMANVINFVNNNITGGGKLFVTVVNVFGSWVGDFVSPGQKKEEKPLADGVQTTEVPNAIGGTELFVVNPTPTPVEENQDNTQEAAVVKTRTRRTIISYVDSTPSTTRSRSLSYARYTGSAMVLAQVTEQEDQFTVPDDETVANPQKMKINLAWLILSLPFGIIAWISRRLEILAHIKDFLPHG